jgi:hypothetical protein
MQILFVFVDTKVEDIEIPALAIRQEVIELNKKYLFEKKGQELHQRKQLPSTQNRCGCSQYFVHASFFSQK